VRNTAREGVYQTLIIDLDTLTMSLTNGCYNDDVIQLGPFSHVLLSVAVSVRPAK